MGRRNNGVKSQHLTFRQRAGGCFERRGPSGFGVSSARPRHSPIRRRVRRFLEAKLELVQERGGDPFTEYSLPEAILKLRQGVGRLIRTKSDHGIVVILDNRIVTKPYGRAFMQALPKCPVEIV
jgi:hypothetical protein